MNLLNQLRTRTRLNWLLIIAISLVLYGCGNSGSQQTQPQVSTGYTTNPTTGAVVPGPNMQGGVQSVDENIYFVFDGSGSMDNTVDAKGEEHDCSFTSNCQRKIDGAKAAVTTVVSKLPANHTNLGLYVFDSAGESERIALGGNNRDQFLVAIKNIRADGGTPLGPAIQAGAQSLVAQYGRQLGYGTYRLIVVTDGMPQNMSLVDDAINYIRRSGVPISIYTIGYGMNDPSHPLRKASLIFTAAYTGEQVKDAVSQAVSEQLTFDPPKFNQK